MESYIFRVWLHCERRGAETRCEGSVLVSGVLELEDSMHEAFAAGCFAGGKRELVGGRIHG